MSNGTAQSAFPPHWTWVLNNAMFMAIGYGWMHEYGERWAVLGAALGLIVGWLVAIYWTARHVLKALCAVPSDPKEE